MNYDYATKDYNKESMARVIGKSLPISTKFSIEICDYIRSKTTAEAKKLLKQVAEGKKAMPFKKFNRDLSHKKSIGPGRYPKKPALEIIQLLESVEANAQFKGLNTSNLQIKHICAHLASRPWRYGRQRRRKTKRTHLEIIVEEKQVKDKSKESEAKKKDVPKKESKIEVKQEKPQVEKKKEEAKPTEVAPKKEEVKENVGEVKKEATKTPEAKQDEKPVEKKQDPLEKTEVKNNNSKTKEGKK
ncbi:MAG: 50S ribosomal protein L22 [Nanoarchaeota archaeon]|nr:50S ribosomal protein L22 [Nanoarchaeota archaeon]